MKSLNLYYYLSNILLKYFYIICVGSKFYYIHIWDYINTDNKIVILY